MSISSSFPYVFYVEGNIGSGKTTFLQALENQHSNYIQVIYEPVEQWKSIKDNSSNNILDYFYTNMERYSYLFQSAVFLSRIRSLEQIDTTKKFVFIERSVDCDKLIFARNCFENKTLSEIEWMVYNNWHTWMCTKLIKQNDIPNPANATYIYLKTPPKIAYQRMQKRNRPAEKDVSFDYVKQIHDGHEDWLLNSCVDGHCATSVLEIDGTQDYLENPKILDSIYYNIIQTTL